MKPSRAPIRPLLIAVLLLSAIPLAASARRQAFDPEPYYAPEQWLDFRGARICYLDQGAGDPIVLVHGWAGNIWNWMSVFPELAASRRVIALDLPGHGKSGCPDDFPYSMAAMSDVAIALLDHLDIDRATVAGSSMGGSIVAWTAIRHPDRVQRLVIVDGAGTSVQNPLLKIAGKIMTPATVIPLIHAFFPVSPETIAAAPESEKNRVELAEQLYASDRKKCASLALARSMRSLGREIVDDRLPGITCPTLIVWGSDDGLLPLAAGERYRDLIPGARLVVIPGGNHTPMQWTPQPFLDELERFLTATEQ